MPFRLWLAGGSDRGKEITVFLAIHTPYRFILTISGHRTSETNTKRWKLRRTNSLGSRTIPAFWTDSSVQLGYLLDVVIEMLRRI